jgi:TetR/AcrR family transcriptional regulator, regulator of cefoperazone and chloramphenicol sensitivity
MIVLWLTIPPLDRCGAMKSSNHDPRGQLVSPANSAGHKARPRSRRIRDRAARQQALIVAALKLFASKGYEATTTREIAASAGCAEGLIHRYFSGKAGLLPALLEYRISKEVADLAQHVRPAHSLEDEYLHLVDWAVEHMWADREFLRVAIPRALLDRGFGQVLRRIGPLQWARAIAARLKKFRECRALPEADLDALAQLVTVMGFMFGFMRPAVLRQDRKTAAKTATAIARLLVRGLPSGGAIPQPAPSLTQTPTRLQSYP